MASRDDKLVWHIIGRRAALCLGAAMFFGGWAEALGAGEDIAIPAGALILAFFVPLRELRLVRDSHRSSERVV